MKLHGEDKEIIWYIPEDFLEHYIEDCGLNKETNEIISEVINGKSVEVKREKENDFEKITRFLNGVQITSNKEYEDGSYDKKSRVFIADKGIKVSKKYINYTAYRQQYNAKTKTYIDTRHLPLIDKNGKVIGEQKSIEQLCIEDGRRQVRTNSTIENEDGIYNSETISDGTIEKLTLKIDNKLSGNKEQIQYSNEDGQETYIYMENGVIGEKITKTERGTTIDVYKDGKPYETFEYDENGKAIIQMAGMEELPKDYIKSCYENVLPDYEVVVHEEPKEIYALDEIKQEKEEIEEISTQMLGKETVDIQKDVERMDSVEQQLNELMQEQTKSQEDKFQINEFGEIIRPEKNNFRENLRFDTRTSTDEQVDKVLDQFEKDLENGVFEQEEIKKTYSHKVEKGDDDYIM